MPPACLPIKLCIEQCALLSRGELGLLALSMQSQEILLNRLNKTLSEAFGIIFNFARAAHSCDLSTNQRNNLRKAQVVSRSPAAR